MCFHLSLLSVPSHLVTKSCCQWLHLCIPRYLHLSPYIASWCLQSCADLLSFVCSLLESVMFGCAPVFCCLPACLPACCLPACLPDACLPDCLPACFFPLWVVFVHFCFILLLKTLHPLHLSPRPHHSRDNIWPTNTSKYKLCLRNIPKLNKY